MQQQQHPILPSRSPPDFGAWGLDGATAQIGMQLGHSAVAAGQQYVEKNVGIIYLYLHFSIFLLNVKDV
jgi:protein transport protein YIF1